MKKQKRGIKQGFDWKSFVLFFGGLWLAGILSLLWLVFGAGCASPGDDDDNVSLPLPRLEDGSVDWEAVRALYEEIREEFDSADVVMPPEVDPVPTVVPEPTPAPGEPDGVWDGVYSEAGSQKLRVKPESDNQPHNLAVLLPARLNNSFSDAWIVAGGKTYRDSGRRNINVNEDGSPASNSNGNRRHLWYGVKGGAIGPGVLYVKLKDGSIEEFNRDFGANTDN